MSNDDFPPFVAVGNDELAAGESVLLGEEIICPKCGELHKLEGGKTPSGEVTDFLLFYMCGGTPFLAGIKGKLVPRFGAKAYVPEVKQ